jgi:hypothetical protein
MNLVICAGKNHPKQRGAGDVLLVILPQLTQGPRYIDMGGVDVVLCLACPSPCEHAFLPPPQYETPEKQRIRVPERAIRRSSADLLAYLLTIHYGEKIRRITGLGGSVSSVRPNSCKCVGITSSFKPMLIQPASECTRTYADSCEQDFAYLMSQREGLMEMR